MKAVKGYSKGDYINNAKSSGMNSLEFSTVEAAAEYVAAKYNKTSIIEAKEAILNDTNCDAICFDDGSVILYEF